MQLDVAGQHVWLNMPEDAIVLHMEHYLLCKATAPHSTSACVLVPSRFSSSRDRRLLRGMHLVMQIRLLHGAMWHVYYDAPLPDLRAARISRSLADSDDLLMSYTGVVSGSAASVLIDTGASHAYLSNQFAQRCGLSVRPSEATVTLATGVVTPVIGTCSVLVRIGQYSERLSVYVADLASDWDLILGQSWLEPHHAVINFQRNSVTFWKSNKHHILSTSDMHTCQAKRVASPHLLSVAQVQRAVKQGCRTFLVNVTAQPEGSPPDLDPGIQSVIDEYSDRFPEGRFPKLETIPPVRVGHTIPLQDPSSQPPFRPLYRLSPLEHKEADSQIQLLLEAGLIEPSSSPYGAPILFAAKKDGGLRMCIDYRALNKLTVKNRYPLPRIDDLLDAAQGAQVFSSIDLLSGYHQIRIQPEDIPKTAFRTPFGLFQWKVLSFGLTNAPATFQAVMNDVLRPVIGKFALVYLDDILIFSKDIVEHSEHIRTVLQLLRDNQLYAKMSKCTFAQPELEFLGHVLGRDGLRVDPRKTAVVAEWPVPRDLSQLRTFLGMANYFRKFIQNYAQRTLVLTRMLRKDRAWEWLLECQKAFEDIKTALTTAPVLALPDFSKPFDVVCDASGLGLGAVLLQDGQPIAFESRQFSSAEQNYSTTEQELLACVHALKVWRCYLEGAGEFTLHTDHGANTFLDTQPNLSRRQARWQEFLSRFHFTWKFIPGVRNTVADPLSRRPTGAPGPTGTCMQHLALLVMTRAARAKVASPAPSEMQGTTAPARPPVDQTAIGGRPPSATATPSLPDMPSVSDMDVVFDTPEPLPDVQHWVNKLIAGYAVDPWFSNQAHLENLILDEDLWHKDGKIVVPDCGDLRLKLISDFHDTPYAGHLGINKTNRLVSRYYWWPNMVQDVTNYVKECHSCQTIKVRQEKPSGLLNPLELPQAPWECISLDFITQLPMTRKGHDAILVVVNKLTKMVHIIPTVTTCTAVTVAELYRDHVFKLHGVPVKVISDRDLRFTSAFIKELCALVGARQAMSTPYHPQTDGQTERVNRVLEDMLRHFVSPVQDDWDQHLSCAEFAINNADHDSTGSSPFVLNYGYSPRIPFSVSRTSSSPPATDFVERMQRRISEARVLHKAASARQKAYADPSRKSVHFQPKQWVLLSSKNLRFKMGTPKLLPRFVGPFQVCKQVGRDAYELVLPENWKIHDTFHVSQLAEYHLRGSYQPPPPAELLEGELEYEVECILDHKILPSRKEGPTFEYLIRWSGHGSDSSTWEPERNLKNASQVVQIYWDNLQAQGMKIPWSKPTFVSAIDVAQRRGRAARAHALLAGSVHGPIPRSHRRRVRKKGYRPGPAHQPVSMD